MAKSSPQNYPRISDIDNAYYGCLDDQELVSHSKHLSTEEMNHFILDAIRNAETKSGREILHIPGDADTSVINSIYQNEGKALFKYFRQYCGDPAATAHQLFNEHYSDVGIEQFRLRTLQKERMNSGWRYQFLAFDCANSSGRFRNVSEIGTAEADFNAVIDFKNQSLNPLNLYVSVKNRTNTLGGQDWPKAIQALEQVAVTDRNRHGPYLCVFGMAMDQGRKNRSIKTNSKTHQPYSVNSEVWMANYFWPFFANYSYDEIMYLVLEVLLETKKDELPGKIAIPKELLSAFGNSCNEHGLLDKEGRFNNPKKLVEFFCKR